MSTSGINNYMIERKCFVCKIEKPLDSFYRSKRNKHGRGYECKQCINNRMREYVSRPDIKEKKAKRYEEYGKFWYQENKDLFKEYYNRPEIAEKRKERYQKNKLDPKYKEKQKEWSNKPHVKEKRKKYYQENKEYLSKQWNHKYHNDPLFKLQYVLRSRVLGAIKYQKAHKNSKTEELLGCTYEDLKVYLENQFAEGMSWDNHGKWHIDHIIPVANFDLTDIEQQKKCFHYTNLQPLWAQENMSKGYKIL